MAAGEINLVTISRTAAEPLAVDDYKKHCRIDGTDDDAYVADLAALAREEVEDTTRRTLITTTYDLTLDGFPGLTLPMWGGLGTWGYTTPREYSDVEIRLPRNPVQSVVSIQYIDTAGQTQTLDPTAYIVDTSPLVARIVPAYGQIWPVTQCRPAAVVVRFVAGFGDDADAVPEKFKHLMRFLVADYYENREPTAPGAMNKLAGMDRLKNLCKTWGL